MKNVYMYTVDTFIKVKSHIIDDTNDRIEKHCCYLTVSLHATCIITTMTLN